MRLWMSFLTVFIPSLVFTAIIGLFLPLAWRVASTPWALAIYWGSALLVHLAWLVIPELGGLAPVARWLAIMWFAGMLAALTLLIPFAVLTALSNWFRLKTVSAYLPIVYISCFFNCRFSLKFHQHSRLRRAPGHSDRRPAVGPRRISHCCDVHIGRFIDPEELSRGIKVINGQKVDLLVVTGDLVDDVSQLESSMHALEQSAAPNKIVAILGNHEEMGDLPRILSIYNQHKSRIELLVNKSIAITLRRSTRNCDRYTAQRSEDLEGTPA